MKTQKIAGVLIDYLSPENWGKRYEIARYISLCMRAGFCKTDDQIRLCADRWLAGKRKVTPPGTGRKKRAAKELAKIRFNVPAQLSAAIRNVVTANKDKAVAEYRNGNDKAINALIGQVLRQCDSMATRPDALFIKELLVDFINQEVSHDRQSFQSTRH